MRKYLYLLAFCIGCFSALQNKPEINAEMISDQPITETELHKDIGGQEIVSDNISLPEEDINQIKSAQPTKNLISKAKPVWLWPTQTKRISQHFNRRNQHFGLDINGEFGDDIWAAADGQVIKVISSGWGGGYGHYVIIKHHNGWQTLYAHLRGIYVRPGQWVEQGELIAEMGSTGRSTGSHLHFEIRLNGEKRNPIDYLDQ